MSGARVLHMQKVAGISGSEAHLLSLLPRLRERGWDVRMLMLHEHEPGAWDFARALESRGVPLDAIPLRADVDPIAFVQLAGYLARHRPEIVHTHLVHADAYGQMAGLLARLLCVGRLIPIKGHIVLLRAFAAAKKEIPALELDIAGRGPLEPALRALARELGVADSVRFLGYVAPIQSAIERSAIVVVPSMGEGFGMVALEAMERARPVIAAEIGGLGELVRDGETGVLVAAGEAAPLRDAIVCLAGNLRLVRAMGDAGRRRALAPFLQAT